MRVALFGVVVSVAVVPVAGCRPSSRATLAPVVARSTLPVVVVAAPPRVVATSLPTVLVAPIASPVVINGCDPRSGVGCPPPPTVQCPAPSRVSAGASTTLRADASGQGVRLRWTVARAPREHGFRFAPRFDRNDSDRIVAEGAEVPFTAVIVGEYALRVRALDEFGRAAECESTVAMVSHGLRVELSWDTDGTDVDLHMSASSVARWFVPEDCYYASLQPDRQLADTTRRRWLDTDDTDGHGPENIRVDSPDPERTYRIGVHYFSDHGRHGRTTPTVLVYCGEELAGRFSRSLRGERDSQQNDFWQVASVRFTGGACSVERIDQVRSAAASSSGGRPVVD